MAWGSWHLLPSAHLLVLATNERFLLAWGTFRAILASESHWLQPMLVLSVHGWPTPTCVGRVYVNSFIVGEGVLVFFLKVNCRLRVDWIHVSSDPSYGVESNGIHYFLVME